MAVEIDGKLYSWTQSICASCYDKRFPGRGAVALKPEYCESEQCCDCGEQTDAGIYMRQDPRTVNHPALETD